MELWKHFRDVYVIVNDDGLLQHVEVKNKNA